MSGWTKGPWTEVHNMAGPMRVKTADLKVLVCDVAISPREQEDARLIAAGPELVEALEDLFNCNNAEEGDEQDFCGAMERARSLLARIKGESADD